MALNDVGIENITIKFFRMILEEADFFRSLEKSEKICVKHVRVALLMKGFGNVEGRRMTKRK